MSMSQLDPGQVIKTVLDEPNDALRVNVVAGGSSVVIDSEIADNSAFTPGTSKSLLVAAEVDDVAPSSVSEGNAGTLRMSGNRNLHVQLQDAAGNERGLNITASNEAKVLATAQPGVDIGDVTVNNAAGAAAVNIQDGGNSITVDGTVAATQSGTWNINDISGTISLPIGASTAARQDTGNTSLASIDTKLTDKSQFTKLTDGTDTALITASGELNVLATAQPGVDIGDVTINNAGGGAAVNIQDGGNSITVDGSLTVSATDLDIRDLTSASDSVAAVQSGSWSVAVNNAAGASAVNIQDGGNSITVDGTVAATQSGTWNINNISGTVSLPTGAATQATLSTLQSDVSARLSGSLVPAAFDEIALTYVTVGNGIGQIETAVYKLATVTIKTLTLSYDANDRLSGVVAS